MNISFEMIMNYILDYLLKEKEIIPTEELANRLKRYFIKQFELTEEELNNVRNQSFDKKLKIRMRKVCKYFEEYGLVLQLDSDCFRVTELASKLKEENNTIDKNAIIRNRDLHHNLYAKITGDEKYLYEDDVVSLLDMDVVEEEEPIIKEKKNDTIPLI